MTKLPETQAGNTSLLVVSDTFTRWTEASTLKTEKSDKIAHVFVIEY